VADMTEAYDQEAHTAYQQNKRNKEKCTRQLDLGSSTRKMSINVIWAHFYSNPKIVKPFKLQILKACLVNFATNTKKVLLVS